MKITERVMSDIAEIQPGRWHTVKPRTLLESNRELVSVSEQCTCCALMWEFQRSFLKHTLDELSWCKLGAGWGSRGESMLPFLGRSSKSKTRTQSSERGVVATGKPGTGPLSLSFEENERSETCFDLLSGLWWSARSDEVDSSAGQANFGNYFVIDRYSEPFDQE